MLYRAALRSSRVSTQMWGEFNPSLTQAKDPLPQSNPIRNRLRTFTHTVHWLTQYNNLAVVARPEW